MTVKFNASYLQFENFREANDHRSNKLKTESNSFFEERSEGSFKDIPMN